MNIIFSILLTVLSGWFGQESTASPVQKQSLNPKSTDTISISVSSADVLIQGHSMHQNLEITYHDENPANRSGKLVVNQVKGKIVIKVIPPQQSERVKSAKKLTVKIPGSWNHNLSLMTKSGDSEIKQVLVNELQISVKSAHSSLKKVQIKSSLRLSSRSGDVTFVDVQAQSMTLESTSGDHSLLALKAKKLKLATKSGDIVGNIDTDEVNFQSKSGDIRLICQRSPLRVEGHTTSGDIQLTLPKKHEFALNLSTHSGSLHVDYPVTQSGKVGQKSQLHGLVGNSKKNKVALQTRSGDISLKQGRG